MALDELAPGKLVAQRYQLEKLLGEGGMGAVWSAVHVVTKKRIALKFLKANAAASPSHVRRFLREARAASAVRHPNVVEIHDIVELENGSPVMVMDFLVGESLAALLERRKAVPLAELAGLLLPVISAVGTAHSMGIVHRDIKPDNIFLEQSLHGGLIPRILDFGIAKLSATDGAAAETATLTRTGSVMGTPYYMAPEQVFGERDIDQRADVWAFGVILYEALTGRRPIEGDNFGQLFKMIATGDVVPIAHVAPQLPSDVGQLVDRMLSKERLKRPQDLREVFDALSRHALVSASAFAAPRLELEALREQTAAAYAPTQTPAPGLTPLQFGDGRGSTELLEKARDAAPTSDAFSRSSAQLPTRRSLPFWIGGAALATLLALGGWQITQNRGAAPLAESSRAPTPPSAPSSAANVETAPRPTVQTPIAPPSSSSAPAEAPAIVGQAAKKRVTPQPSVSAPPARPASVTPSAPPTSTSPAKLPGGIAPSAPF